MPSQHVLLPRDVFNAMIADQTGGSTLIQKLAIKQFLGHVQANDEPDDLAEKFSEVARKKYQKLAGVDDIEIDKDPIISASDEGAFVNGWLWVSNSDAGFETDGDGMRVDPSVV